VRFTLRAKVALVALVLLVLPWAGYRYVRVASDILMISIGSGMVVDGIRNLGR